MADDMKPPPEAMCMACWRVKATLTRLKKSGRRQIRTHLCAGCDQKTSGTWIEPRNPAGGRKP